MVNLNKKRDIKNKSKILFVVLLLGLIGYSMTFAYGDDRIYRKYNNFDEKFNDEIVSINSILDRGIWGNNYNLPVQMIRNGDDLMGTKIELVARIQALLPEDLPRLNELEKAYEHLLKSLNIDPKDLNDTWKKYDLWIDQDHLDSKHGHMVFNEERKSVKHLDKVCKEKTCTGLSTITFQNTADSDVRFDIYYDRTVMGQASLVPMGEFTLTANEFRDKVFDRNLVIVMENGERYTVETSCLSNVEDTLLGEIILVSNVEENIVVGENSCTQATKGEIDSISVDLTFVDRALAEVAIGDNIDQFPGCDDDKFVKEFEKAGLEFTKGDEDFSLFKLDKAIKHYKYSWKHSIKAMKVGLENC